MAHLSLSFLGGFDVLFDSQPVTSFGADKVRALLAFLSIESARPYRRAELSGMFWPDLSEKKAAHNLSQSLLRLRTALGEKEEPSRTPFILITPQDIQFNFCSDCQLDVARFRELLNQCSQHQHAEAVTCSVCIQRLRQAEELYRGDLLAGLFVPDSVAFEEWRLVQQEELHCQALGILSQLTMFHEQRGEYDRVIEYARRQIALEPWREAAHIQLIRAFFQSGQVAAALRQYESFQHTLWEEMGIEPSAEASTLYESLRSGEVAKSSTGQFDASAGEAVWLASDGERRQVTLLVCGRANRKDQAAQEDSEEVQEQMATCEQRCEAIFHRFGGRRAVRQGDACLVYFGYPQAYEDAARRAVHSALAIAKAATSADELVRIGIHTGMVTVGEQRGPRWQDRDLVGIAVETARDCQRLASSNEVFITEGTRSLVQEAFDLQAVEPLAGRPLVVYQVRGESSLPGRLNWLVQTQRLTVFTGREDELSQLRACYENLLQGKGQVVFLQGEPGIGKSRLAWELEKIVTAEGDSTANILQPHPPAVWLTSRCLLHDQNTSLYPLIGLLEQMLGFIASDDPDHRREKLSRTLARYGLGHPSVAWLLSLLLGLPSGESAPAPGHLTMITQAQRDQMSKVVITILQKYTREQPTVILIEDLHWSDPSTVDWLGESIDALAAAPCLVLLTARPVFQPAWLPQVAKGAAPRPNLLQIILHPLPSEQTAQIVTDLLGERTLEEAIRQKIVALTDGNPLFIEELTKTLLERPVSQGTVLINTEIPATLRDSLVVRLDHLGMAKETAQWAAVLGREFSYPILQACLPYDEQRLQSDLALLIEAELILPIQTMPQDAAPFTTAHHQRAASKGTAPARYAFKHALVQEAAYTSLLKRTRKVYHRRVAEALESRFPQMAETRPEVLAQHYTSAGLPKKAVDYWLRAGEHATAQGATLEARTFYERALAEINPEDGEQRWRALLGWEAVLNLRGEREAQRGAIEALVKLAEACADDARQFRAYQRWLQFAIRIYDNALMLQTGRAAVAAAKRTGNPDLEALALSSLLQVFVRRRELCAAGLVVEEVLAKLSEVSDEKVKAQALAGVAYYDGGTGNLSRALLLTRQSLEMPRRMGNRQLESRYMTNIGFFSAQLGLYQEACAACEQGLALAEEIDDQPLQTTNRINLSYAYWGSGLSGNRADRDRARAMGEQALSDFKRTGNRTDALAECLYYLGMFLEDAGELTTAAAYLAESADIYSGVGRNATSMEVRAMQARCLLTLERRDEALQVATGVWAFLREYGTEGMISPSRVYGCVADVLAALEAPEVSAQEVIQAGYHQLMANAEKISDLDYRRSFLEKAVENRDLVERWNKKNRNCSEGREAPEFEA